MDRSAQQKKISVYWLYSVRDAIGLNLFFNGGLNFSSPDISLNLYDHQFQRAKIFMVSGPRFFINFDATSSRRACGAQK